MDRTQAFGWIAFAYLVAGLVAVATALAVPAEHPIAVAFWADVAATIVIFGFSVAFRNSSFYDAYWSVAPPAIALYWLAHAGPDASALRQVLVLAVVGAWAVRLTGNWARGWTGIDHEDWRYRDLQEKSGRAYWLVSFGGIHMMPTLWVFGGCLALFPALADATRPFGALDVLALLVAGGAVAIEALADEQLRAFRLAPDRKQGDVLQTGLWRYSRHPNYLGEMGFWWGLWLFGVAANPGWWWTVVGPAAITLMFRFASLPMIETRMLERRPDYKTYAEKTALVLLWPPKP